MKYYEIKELINKMGYQKTFNLLLNRLSKIDFPIYSSVHDDTEARQTLLNYVSNYTPKYDAKPFSQKIMTRKTNIIDYKFQNEFVSIDSSNYEQPDIIIAYFSGKCNMHAKRHDMKHTPYENWKSIEFRKRVLHELLKHKENLTMRTIDFYNYKIGKACTYFKLSTVFSTLKIFNSKKVLDPCAGWGERLLGSILCGTEYTGFDPSECLKPVYDHIIQLFNAQNTARVYSVGAEFMNNYLKPTDMFDMIITSPPFFDLEVYNNDVTQSIKKYPTFDVWFHKFLLYFITLSWEHLENNGHMVLFINDYIKDGIMYEYTERTILYCGGYLPQCQYEGIIGKTGDSKKYYSMFCFKKNIEITENTQTHFKELYKTYYDSSMLL